MPKAASAEMMSQPRLCLPKRVRTINARRVIAPIREYVTPGGRVSSPGMLRRKAPGRVGRAFSKLQRWLSEGMVRNRIQTNGRYRQIRWISTTVPVRGGCSSASGVIKN